VDQLSPLDFEGRVAVVTGAGRPLGLGAAYARMLASRGARVVINDVQDCSEVVKTITAAGGSVVADGHDISTDDGARGLIESALDAFGQLDAVVNNAGVAPMKPFPEMTWEVFDQTLKVHVYGSFFVTRYAWPHLIATGRGRVVIISSKAALWGETAKIAPYGTAKGAQLGLTRQLAVEGAPHGICVNAVFPTAMTFLHHPRADELAEQLGMDPTDREGLSSRSSELVAAVVTWLCHPDCTVSGEFFKAQAGEAQRVSFAITPGIGDLGLTPETVRDRFAEICEWSGATAISPFRGHDR
jgi:NAD(P)-dependent dehydrogenase (short-subunit alcohol dehydrogenase family)